MPRAASLVVILLAASCGSGAPRGTSADAGSGDAGADAGSDAGIAAGTGGATGACASCGGGCVDLANDPRHCGACGNACPSHTLCDRGACAVPVCLLQGPLCPTDHLCCADACCPPWEICCNVPDASAPRCVPLDAGACPTDCGGGAATTCP